MNTKEFELALAVNCYTRIRLSSPIRPTCKIVICSSGYGPPTFDRPLASAIAQELVVNDIAALQYVYPERYSKNRVSDLLLTTGVFYILQLLAWCHEQGYSQVGLYGNSFGGNISIETALIHQVDFMILSNAVLDFVHYRKAQLGSAKFSEWESNRLTTITYEDGSFTSSYRFIEEATQQKLAKRLLQLKMPLLVFLSENDEILQMKKLRSVFKSIGSRTVSLPKTSHSITAAEALRVVREELNIFLKQFKHKH